MKNGLDTDPNWDKFQNPELNVAPVIYMYIVYGFTALVIIESYTTVIQKLCLTTVKTGIERKKPDSPIPDTGVWGSLAHLLVRVGFRRCLGSAASCLLLNFSR